MLLKGKIEVLGKKKKKRESIAVPIRPPQTSHGLDPESNLGLRTVRSATNRFFFIVLCILSVILCPDCPGFGLLSLLYNTNIHDRGGIIFFLLSCTLYFIRTCVFVLIVLHFAFYFSLQHTTQISMPPAEFKPSTPASDPPKTLALGRSATGIGIA